MTAAAPVLAAHAEPAPPAGGCDALPGDELIRRFEACTLDGASFCHADHLRLAWEYHRRLPPAEALVRVAAGLRRFAAANGSPHRYHETITWAFMLVVGERIATTPPGAGWPAFCAANPDLFDRGRPILGRYYRPETLESDLARRVFLMPDRLAGTAG